MIRKEVNLVISCASIEPGCSNESGDSSETVRLNSLNVTEMPHTIKVYGHKYQTGMTHIKLVTNIFHKADRYISQMW